MKIFLFVFMFFIFGALLIISNNNFIMCKQENFSGFSELYINWINQLYSNLQVLTGNVVGMDWFLNE